MHLIGPYRRGTFQSRCLEPDELATFPYRQFLPSFERFRISGLDFDTSAPEKTDEPATGKPERIKFALKNFETVLKNRVNGFRPISKTRWKISLSRSRRRFL